jgi:hypothetical protein
MDALENIGRLQWQLAKTMPEIPHEYTVRSPETEADYVALFTAIQSDGVFERYKRRKKRYLYPGDGRKYWAMTTHLPSSRVLTQSWRSAETIRSLRSCSARLARR